MVHLLTRAWTARSLIAYGKRDVFDSDASDRRRRRLRLHRLHNADQLPIPCTRVYTFGEKNDAARRKICGSGDASDHIWSVIRIGRLNRSINRRQTYLDIDYLIEESLSHLRTHRVRDTSDSRDCSRQFRLCYDKPHLDTSDQARYSSR